MLDWIVKLLDKSGHKLDKANYGDMLQFRNINKAKLDWDNDKLEEDEGLIEGDTGDNPYPYLPAEI